MFNIAVIDDERYAREKLITLIHHTLIHHEIDYRIDNYDSATSFLQAHKTYQLLFLDIEMGQENGVMLSKMLYEQECKSIIVFVTSYDGYIRNAFGLNIYAYVMKEEVEKRIPEVLQEIMIEQNKKAYMIVQTELGPITYRYDEILYIMIDDRKCYVYTKQECNRIFASTLKGIKEDLNEDFLQPNAKYLVNAKYIASIEQGDVIMYNQEHIRISRGKVKAFTEEYKSYLMKGI